MGSVVFYGGFMFMMTGVSMVTAAVVYHVLQPEPIMRLICAQKGITLHYGWCFWAVLIVGKYFKTTCKSVITGTL